MNLRFFAVNYSLLCLVCGMLSIISSPPALACSLILGAAWHFILQPRSMSITLGNTTVRKEHFQFALIGVTTITSCWFLPDALSDAFGIGGSIVIAHASLRNFGSHRDDEDASDDGTASGDDTEAPLRSIRSARFKTESSKDEETILKVGV